jgi:RimJ/RimL family protein N-acetyltransferase
MPKYTSPVRADLTTVRVTQLDPRHLDAFYALQRDADANRFTRGGPTVFGREEFVRAFKADAEQPGPHFIIESVVTGEFVGHCGVTEAPSNYLEIFIVLTKEWQGRGVGNEVLQYLCAFVEDKSLVPLGYVHPENGRSMGLMERLGFIQIPTEGLNPSDPTWLAFARAKQEPSS